MRKHLQLKKAEREYLETLLARGQLRAKVFKRATALLELDRGKTLEAIATTLNVNRVSVMRWRDSYRRQALKSLEDAPPFRPTHSDRRHTASQDHGTGLQ
jgi:putative transposase